MRPLEQTYPKAAPVLAGLVAAAIMAALTWFTESRLTRSDAVVALLVGVAMFAFMQWRARRAANPSHSGGD